MQKRNFHAALREADRVRSQQTMSPAAERRLRQRIEAVRTRRTPSFMPWATAALATAAGVALAFLSLNTPEVLTGPEQIGAFAVADAPEGSVRERADGAVEIAASSSGARLEDRVGGISISARAGATLRRDANGLRVLGGEVLLDVRKRRPGEAPAVVLVSHGAIEVLGTQFTITQAAEGGEVVLHEGRIRFRATDGRTVELVPGDSLRWPLPSEVAARVEPSVPAPVAPGALTPDAAPVAGPTGAPVPDEAAPAQTPAEIAARTRPSPPSGKPADAVGARSPRAHAAPAPSPVVPDVAKLIEEITTLRRLGRFGEAAGKLESALTAPLPSATRERLSYELGSILTWQVRDPQRACKVWATHRAAWPNGRYSAEVDRASSAFSCPDKE